MEREALFEWLLANPTPEHLTDAMGLLTRDNVWMMRRTLVGMPPCVLVDNTLRDTYDWEARHGSFEAYMIAVEWDREPRKKFYLPRRRQLKPLVDALQDLFDDRIAFLGVSCPPRVGKSSTATFFMTYLMGMRPDTSSLAISYSDTITRNMYNEIISILTDADTYRWGTIFPREAIVKESAMYESVDIGTVKRYPTLTCRSLGGTLTGATQASRGGLLYSDDLVKGIDEALSITQLDKKYQEYLDQAKDRKLDGAMELMIGTRWNVFDPLGKIKEQYDSDPRYKFLVMPAVDEQGHSNFVYKYGLGFSDEYYADMKSSLDSATWAAKYMGRPFIREGLLFPEDDMIFYNGELPDGEPDRIVAVCDTAWGGGDYLSMPIAAIYGSDMYIVDVVFSNGDKSVTRPLVEGMLKKWHPHMMRWESNNGGDEYGGIVDKDLRDEGCVISMSYKKAPTHVSKASRIMQYSTDIKRFKFLIGSKRSEMYQKFMEQTMLYTITGKNEHDDAPDSLSMMADFILGQQDVVSVFKRPF